MKVITTLGGSDTVIKNIYRLSSDPNPMRARVQNQVLQIVSKTTVNKHLQTTIGMINLAADPNYPKYSIKF